MRLSSVLTHLNLPQSTVRRGGWRCSRWENKCGMIRNSELSCPEDGMEHNLIDVSEEFCTSGQQKHTLNGAQ